MWIKNSDLFIFFDDGDILNDNKIQGKQWQELVGESFSSKFGGESELWGAANVKIIKNFNGKDIPKLIYENREKSHELLMDWFIEKWINEMGDFVGVKRHRI